MGTFDQTEDTHQRYNISYSQFVLTQTRKTEIERERNREEGKQELTAIEFVREREFGGKEGDEDVDATSGSPIPN